MITSTYGSNADGKQNALLHPHVNYLALGETTTERCAAYRALVADTLSDDDLDAIRGHVQRQHALGTNRFCEAIEAQPARRVGPTKMGRPRKESSGP